MTRSYSRPNQLVAMHGRHVVVCVCIYICVCMCVHIFVEEYLSITYKDFILQRDWVAYVEVSQILPAILMPQTV